MYRRILVPTDGSPVSGHAVGVASEHACELIVMGSHGRRSLSRLLMGSVTQAVLAYAPVPVMVVRPAPASAAAQALARPCPAEGRT